MIEDRIKIRLTELRIIREQTVAELDRRAKAALMPIDMVIAEFDDLLPKPEAPPPPAKEG